MNIFFITQCFRHFVQIFKLMKSLKKLTNWTPKGKNIWIWIFAPKLTFEKLFFVCFFSANFWYENSKTFSFNSKFKKIISFFAQKFKFSTQLNFRTKVDFWNIVMHNKVEALFIYVHKKDKSVHTINHRLYDDRCAKLSEKSQGTSSSRSEKKEEKWIILSGWQKVCWFSSWVLSVFLAMESPFGPFGDSGFTAFFTTSFSSWLSLTW